MMHPSLFPPMSSSSIIPLGYRLVSVSRGTAEFLTIHAVKSCPDADDAAGQGPPTMLRIAATTSAGSIRTV